MICRDTAALIAYVCTGNYRSVVRGVLEDPAWEECNVESSV